MGSSRTPERLVDTDASGGSIDDGLPGNRGTGSPGNTNAGPISQGESMASAADATGSPEVQVGTAVLAERAAVLARPFRHVVAQQRVDGLWSLPGTLVRTATADLITHAHIGLRCVAAYGLRHGGDAR